MIALAFLLLAGAQGGAEDAERAFALKAQTDGQWTAFRVYAAEDAIMFAPEKVNVRAFLKDKQDPSRPMMWWPGTVYPSCDGDLAISTGPWVTAANGTQGTFTTVWKRQADGAWKWLLDHGRDTPKLVPAGRTPIVNRGHCDNLTDQKQRERRLEVSQAALAASLAIGGQIGHSVFVTEATVIQREGQMPEHGKVALPPLSWGETLAFGNSDDWTLAWENRAIRNAAPGAHDLRVWQWRGEKGWMLALYDITGVKAP